MAMCFYLLATLAVPVGVSRPSHAIYISVVEVSLMPGADDATLRIKIFTNDLEDALKNEFQKQISIAYQESCKKSSAEILSYFKRHFSLKADQQRISWQLGGCETEGDATWLSFQGKTGKEWKEVEIFADFLIELFPAQSNVVSVDYHGTKRFTKLSKGNESAILKF